ncbi:nodulation receptor kinase-like [Rhodamnia argentea]|uniref:Nodulation receptor kinase-like n=1 Tax=Rhodamnia argentea TaxID=178133 RepID=A0A8B8P2Y1_9MYRT|nr:nodulation receptor kinase-like [Rhodamnia argentea]
MMERLTIWPLGLVNFVAFCFLAIVQSSSAQKGFVSLRCCEKSNLTDSNGIVWTTDDEFFPDRQTCQEILRPVKNSKGNYIRTFDIVVPGKVCYHLRTLVPGQDYLVRADFSYGDSLAPSLFGVLIGVTPIALVSLVSKLAVEGIFRVQKGYVDFCLLKEEGDPYISQLELRPLNNDSDYLNGDSGTVLKVIRRVNLGGTGGDIRYPDDPSDRIWKPEAEPIGGIINATTEFHNHTRAPIKVLQTAVTSSDRMVLFSGGLDIIQYNYTIFLYFLELNSSIGVGERVFDIYVNSEKTWSGFDIQGQGSIYREVALNATASGSLNLTLAKVSNESVVFGPICNAYEILQVHSWVQESLQGDVDAMLDMRHELLQSNSKSEVLATWWGDPCLPIYWQGLVCDYSNGSSVVTKMDLSSSKLTGFIPSGIAKLVYLTEVNLSYNLFSGKIPSFPTSSLLRSLDVRGNDLLSPIPGSLFSLPYLTTLYFGCNPHFTNAPPASFKNSNLTTDHGRCTDLESPNSKKGLVIITVACGSVLTIALGILIFCLYRRKCAFKRYDIKGYTVKKNAVSSIPSKEDFVLKSISIQTFTLQCIEATTQKYKTLIGEGGFGSVYGGTLPDGQEVAVKVRSATSTQGTREFENELNLLSAIRHENLVPLLGFCCESDQQMLVYPFMSNGSLQDRLYGEASKRKILDWPTRLSIALGSARGLTHLHNFSGRCVIHRDVKSSNILLDQSMNAKVADFGFSKYAPQEGDSGASLEVRGTAGYLDPEYYSTQHLSAKSDVFSFGVVLLEIISGREPLNIHRPRNEWSLVEWAKPYIREQKIDEIVDPNIKGMYHAEAMWRVVEVALACIEPFSAYRPSMADIVRELEDALIIENNASEYLKSIDSFGGSNRFSIIIEKKAVLSPTQEQAAEPSPLGSQPLAPPEPR